MAAGSATRTANVMFCDVVRSTERRAAMGEVEADRFFRDVEQVLRSVVAEHGGTTVKGAGDGIMAVFDAASEAIGAAVALHREIARHEFDVELRVGVAAGDVSWEDNDCFGLPVVVASRLEGACEPGSVLVSAIVRLLAGDRADVIYDPLGALELKGIPEPVDSFAVLWIESDAPATKVERYFPGSLPPAGRHPFVGRDHEELDLHETWSRVREGGRATALIAGEAGAGKTRLATEVARQVFDSGAFVLAGVCDSELSRPYQPWAMALADLVAQLPGEVADDCASTLGDLHSLLPSVERLGAPPSTPQRSPEEERRRMFNAVAALLRRAVTVAPVMIVIDDLHWAGQQTLALLRYLVRTEPVDRTMLVATFRDTSDQVSEGLEAVLADFRRDERVGWMSLQGIDTAAVRQLLVAAVRDEHTVEDVVDRQAAEISARTSGNAFMVGELAAQLSAGVALSSVPDSVRDVVSARVQRLTPESRSVVNLIAVGGRVALPVLRTASGLDVRVLEAALVEAVHSGLVQELTASVPSYQFAHALIREAVDGGLPQILRVGVHEALAVATEQAYEADRRPVLAELARHFVGAAPLVGWQKAAHYGRRAAAQARRSAAYSEAIELVERTCEVVPVGTSDYAQLAVDAADLLQRDGRNPEAVAWANRALDAAASAGDVELQASAAMELERAGHLANAPDMRTVTLLGDLFAGADRLSPATVAKVLASLGRAQYLVGMDQGLAATREALVLSEKLDPDERAHALEAALVVEQDPLRILQYTGELATITRQSGHVFRYMWALNRRIFAGFVLGRLAEVDALNTELLATAADYRLASYEFLGRASASTLALVRADFEEAERSAEAANVAANERYEGIDASGVYGFQMFMIRREQGRLEETRPVLQLLARSDNSSAWRPGLLAAYHELDMMEKAAALFDELAADDFGPVPRDVMWPSALAFLVEAAVGLGRSEAAPALAAALEPYAGHTMAVGYTTNLGPADRLRAIVAEWSGDSLSADVALASAGELCELSGSPLWSAQLAASAAWIASRRGDGVLFDTHVEQAMDLVDRHGLEGVRQRLEKLTADVSAVPSGTVDTSGTAAWPDGLSGREIEVLALLGRGLTNRAIGEKLFISQNTVANHVRKILQKTASNNRTEAARYAIERGLVVSDTES